MLAKMHLYTLTVKLQNFQIPDDTKISRYTSAQMQHKAFIKYY